MPHRSCRRGRLHHGISAAPRPLSPVPRPPIQGAGTSSSACTQALRSAGPMNWTLIIPCSGLTFFTTRSTAWKMSPAACEMLMAGTASLPFTITCTLCRTRCHLSSRSIQAVKGASANLEPEIVDSWAQRSNSPRTTFHARHSDTALRPWSCPDVHASALGPPCLVHGVVGEP